MSLNFQYCFYTLCNKSSLSFIKYISKEKKCFTNCCKSYSSLVLSKNVLSVKHSAHFDFTFPFLFDIKTSIFGCWMCTFSVLFTIFTKNVFLFIGFNISVVLVLNVCNLSIYFIEWFDLSFVLFCLLVLFFFFGGGWGGSFSFLLKNKVYLNIFCFHQFLRLKDTQ